MTPDDLEKKRLPVLRWLIGLGSIVAGVVAFDPHFPNIKFVFYILRTLSPELTLLGVVTAVIIASRSGFLVLVSRHRALFLVIGVIVIWSSDTIARKLQRDLTGTRKQDVAAFTEKPGSTLYSWLSTRPSAYSFRQPEFFHEDMRLRAVDAFLEHDVQGAASYLGASQAIFPKAVADSNADDALQFLISRQRYIDNHKSRIAELEKQNPLAPLRLYLMRAVSQLERDDQRDPALVALRERLRLGAAQARTGLDSCLNAATEADIGADGRSMLNLILDTMGDLPLWQPAASYRQWCQSLVPVLGSQAARTTFRNLFGLTLRNFWGSALDDPAQEKESGAPKAIELPDETPEPDLNETDFGEGGESG